MSLHFPTIAQVNTQNLEIFKNLDTTVANAAMQPLTELAHRCFDEIKESELSKSYYARKYTCTALAFLGTITVPVVVGTAALIHFAPRTTEGWLALALTVGGTLGIDKAAKLALNFSPIKMGVTLARAAIVHGAGKVSDATLGSYNRYEKEIHNKHKELLKQITENLKATYDGMALELISYYSEAKENPANMYSLKETAQNALFKLPLAAEGMKQLGLSIAESSQIIYKFEEALKLITAFEFALTTNNPSYNIRLILDTPAAAIGSICIPQEVFSHLQNARMHTRTYTHEIKKHLSTAAGAIASFSLPMTIAYVGETSPINKTVTALFSLVAGAGIGKYIFSVYQKTHLELDTIAAQNKHSAKDILCQVYDEMAMHLLSQKSLNKKRKKHECQLIIEASALQAKLPQIHKHIEQCSMDPQEVTHNLQKALDTILTVKPEAAPRKSARLAKKHI